MWGCMSLSVPCMGKAGRLHVYHDGLRRVFKGFSRSFKSLWVCGSMCEHEPLLVILLLSCSAVTISDGIISTGRWSKPCLEALSHLSHNIVHAWGLLWGGQWRRFLAIELDHELAPLLAHPHNIPCQDLAIRVRVLGLYQALLGRVGLDLKVDEEVSLRLCSSTPVSTATHRAGEHIHTSADMGSRHAAPSQCTASSKSFRQLSTILYHSPQGTSQKPGCMQAHLEGRAQGLQRPSGAW